MWNTFSSLRSRFKIYKEKHLTAFAKPTKHLKASQQKMFHGDQLGLLRFAHKEVHKEITSAFTSAVSPSWRPLLWERRTKHGVMSCLPGPKARKMPLMSMSSLS